MTKDEKILIAVGALLCVAVVIWRKPIIAVVTGDDASFLNPQTDIGVSQTTENSSLVRGPAYLMYNQPYAFAPPIGNFLPSITAGQGNQTVNKPTNFEGEIDYPSYH